MTRWSLSSYLLFNFNINCKFKHCLLLESLLLDTEYCRSIIENVYVKASVHHLDVWIVFEWAEVFDCVQRTFTEQLEAFFLVPELGRCDSASITGPLWISIACRMSCIAWHEHCWIHVDMARFNTFNRYTIVIRITNNRQNGLVSMLLVDNVMEWQWVRKKQLDDHSLKSKAKR